MRKKNKFRANFSSYLKLLGVLLLEGRPVEVLAGRVEVWVVVADLAHALVAAATETEPGNGLALKRRDVLTFTFSQKENIARKINVAILERTHDERLHQHRHYYCRFLEIAMAIYFLFFYKSG